VVILHETIDSYVIKQGICRVTC